MTDSQRISIQHVAPEAYQAVYGLEQYIRKHLDSELLHLIKLRASILNGCSFCVDMHSREGLAEGMDSRKLFAVGAWRDAPFFDAKERAALELTDAVTRLTEHGVSDEVYKNTIEHFGEAGVANLLMAIATINVWNRLTVPTRQQPPVDLPTG